MADPDAAEPVTATATPALVFTKLAMRSMLRGYARPDRILLLNGVAPERLALPPARRRFPPDLRQHHLLRNQRSEGASRGLGLWPAALLRAHAPLVSSRGVRFQSVRAGQPRNVVGGILGGDSGAS